jgi:glycosyltransferase involved in cell wall biosynthesis
MKLVALGRYDHEVPSHKQVLDAVGDEVMFPGAIYDKATVSALRFHSSLYAHGHQVGGTNPSLVEAMGAGSAVLAHDNHFNRWVAGPGARYFEGEQQCADQLDAILSDQAEIARMRDASRERHVAMFTWEKVLGEYEGLLAGWLG